MFGWWKREPEGFEWRKHVRTTIKLRREDRARKIEEIKQAAAAGAKAAGQKAGSAGRSGVQESWRGLKGASGWSWTLVVRGLERSWHGVVGAMTSVWRGVSSIGGLRNFTGLSNRIPARIKIASMFGGLGLLAGLSAYLQFVKTGADWSSMLAAVVATVLAGLAVAPWLRRAGQQIVDRLPAGGFRGLPYRAAAVIAMLVVVGSGGFFAWQSGVVSQMSSSVLSALPSMPSIGGGSAMPDITGRARAVSGDTMRIDGRMVRLAGVEAPEVSQVCRDRRRRVWRCGQRARSALRRLVRRRHVICKDVSAAEGGRFEASCWVGDRDVAAQLVGKGYAYAQGAVFKTYAEAEKEAQGAKRGVWQGEAERPEDFRAKRWKRASKSAPDGCPIKGRVVRKTKVYVLPWALEYRQVRVRQRRGERWFCSEADAAAAGFRPSSTG